MSIKVPYTELLKEMISIPATSRNEERRASFLEEFLMGMGHEVTRLHNNLLLGDPGPSGKRTTILLNSHLDTVVPVAGWKTDPFEPLVEGERITGLGSNDAGASVVSMIAAYHEMAPKIKDQIKLLLLISSEEEVSGALGIESLIPMLGKLDGVIVGEPTGMQPAVAERGLMVLDGTVKGVAGHAARKEGVNAIYKAMDDVKAISSLTFSEPSQWLPPAGAQVTLISAGTGHNVVPDECKFVVDVRSNDRYRNERMLEMISSVCEAELIPRSTRLKPSMLSQDHFLMDAIRANNLEPFGSSTLSDMALIPFPAVKMGPGDSARSHTADEYILESELENGVKGYCNFLKTLTK
ncbi:MAG: M20 family metallo-hydrolase [Bacteroidetes bacterium]|nr:M20 family metallo-hydrolase [Bacteroidota bacterium]